MLNTSNNKQSNSGAAKLFLNGLFAVILTIGTLAGPLLANAQTTNDNKDQKSDIKTDDKNDAKSAKDLAKDSDKEKKTAKDIKTITDRINKNKDEYVVQIRSKFLLNADNLSAISAKIDTRISKIEISGEDVTTMNDNLDDANESIKKAKALLKTLPTKKSLIDYTDAKKYAGTIIEARDNLENAKSNLSAIISDLKDLVIDKDDDKN
jgi:hypothetical protein